MFAAAISTEVVTLIGALGIGSVLGQYIASAKDRRETRARVLTALADAESGRWAGLDSKAHSEFLTSLRQLQAAALVARLPRDAIWEYAVLAQAARWESEENWERLHDPEIGGGIDHYLAQATREAARAIAVIAWSPAPTHAWRWRRAKKRIDQSLAKLQSAGTESTVDKSRKYGFM